MELTYKITFSNKASKDYKELKRQGLEDKVDSILAGIAANPYSCGSKRLKGEHDDLYSIRLNRVDRIVYEITDEIVEGYDGVVNIVRMRTHYQGIIPMFAF